MTLVITVLMIVKMARRRKTISYHFSCVGCRRINVLVR